MVNPDFRDLFAALNEAEASFIVVRAHAVAFYAEPRCTKDLDIWVAAWPNRQSSVFGDQPIWIIGREELVQNKTASARPQDLLDLDLLRKHG